MTKAKTAQGAAIPVGQAPEECYDAVTARPEAPATPVRPQQRPAAPTVKPAPSSTPHVALGRWVRTRATVIAAIATTFLAAFAAGSFAMDILRGFEERIYARVDERFEAMDQRFEAMDQRFEAMDRRFEALESDVAALRRDFEAFRIELDGLNEAVSALREDVALIRGAVVGLEPAGGAAPEQPSSSPGNADSATP